MENCSNSMYTGRLHLRKAQNLSIGVLLASTCLPMFLIHFSLVVSLIGAKQLTNTTNVYILILSISDCLQGVVTTPMEASLFILYPDRDNCNLSVTSQFFTYSNTAFSGYLILLIAFDRHIHIRTDLKQNNGCLRKIASKNGSVVLLSVCFIQSVLFGVFAIIGNKYTDLYVAGMAIIDAFLVIVVYVLYIKIYLKVRRHYRECKVYSERGNNSQSPSATPKYIKKLSKTVLLILMPMAMCYYPIVLVSAYLFYAASKNDNSDFIQFIYYLLMSPVSFNAMWNASVVFYRNKLLRKYLSNKICVSRVEDQNMNSRDREMAV